MPTGKKNPHYTIEQNDILSKELAACDMLLVEIHKAKPYSENLWQTIQSKLLFEWTYHSNAIEGSTLTLEETISFLQSRLTVEEKPFKDFVDAKNHAEAVEYVYEIISGSRKISPALIKEFNALLMSGIKSTPALDKFGNKIEKPATPGEYKTLPNHVLQNDSSIHKYTDPVHVASEMDELCRWIAEQNEKLHPAIVAALAHYNMVRIHPFDDGNGRGARILMNIVLMQKGFPPAVIKNEKRRIYIDALSAADNGFLLPFIRFITESSRETMEMIIRELNGGRKQL